MAWFGGSTGVTIWASSNLFGALFNGLFSLIVASLWLAPLWGWLMLASSWAKKVAFLWRTLPIFMISVAEGMIFHSSNFIEMVGVRIAEVFASMEFWAGLVVSAIFLAGAVFTRRHRDES